MENYVIDRELGSGGQGIVYLAKRLDNVEVALKKIKIGAENSLSDVVKEVNILKSLTNKGCHPNIICYDDIFYENDYVYLVTDYVEGLDFSETVENIKKEYCKKDFQDIFIKLCRDILCALSFIHDKGIVHADIKSENVLVRIIGDKKYQPVIIDFGLSCITKDKSCKKAVGTLEFIAPEVLKNKIIYPESDLWSFGIMLYDAYFGSTPWPRSLIDQPSNDGLIKYIARGNYNFTFETGNLLIDAMFETLLQKNYKRRMSAQSLCDILSM